MAKSKLYIRTLSTILSVLTIFSGIYKSYEVKAVKPGDGAQAGNTEDEASNQVRIPSVENLDESYEDKEADLSSQEVTTAVESLTSSEKKAVAASNSQVIVPEKLCEKASEIIESDSKNLGAIWEKCLEHFKNILSFCEKEREKKHLTEEEKKALSQAFRFIILNENIFPLSEGAVAQVSSPLGGFGLNVDDDLVTTYASLYTICYSAVTGESYPKRLLNGVTNLFGNEKESPKLDDAAFAQNAYKVFQKNMGKSNTDKGSIWNLTYKSQFMLSNRILLLKQYGITALNPMIMKFHSILDIISDSKGGIINEFCRGLTGAVNDSAQDIKKDLADGGVNDIIDPIANKMEGALQNAATTSLGYAKTAALQTGAGLAGIFVASKLVCNLISKIGSDSNNRNKQQQKQAVAENCEKSE